MKIYQTREQLTIDVNYIKETVVDTDYKNELINELFNAWKYTARDSPWNIIMKQKEKEAVRTLIKISEEGISNEWCGEHLIFEDIKDSINNKGKGKRDHHTYNLRKRN